jgi:predicted ribosomally synthesized peptide with SipW-like signal peptide
MKSIIKSLLIVVAVAAIAGGATYAAWNSVKSSNENEFVAGTLNLQLSKNGYTDTAVDSLFNETNLAPGAETAPKTLYFKNTGSVPGKVKLKVSYVNWDSSNPYGGVSDNDFARNLQLVSSSNESAQDFSSFWAAQIVRRAYTNSRDNALDDMAIYTNGSADFPTMYGLAKTTFYFENDDHDGLNPTN